MNLSLKTERKRENKLKNKTNKLSPWQSEINKKRNKWK